MDVTYKTVGKMAERWGWDYCDDYGEPGYAKPYGAEPHAGIILGNYWCRCDAVQEVFRDGRWTRLEDGDTATDGEEIRNDLHGLEHHYPRLFAALKEQGWQLEWSDEWIIDQEGGSKCYRTQGDSYSWQPTAIWTEGGDLLTPDSGIDAWVEEMANNPGRCITARAFRVSELAAAGFVQWEPGNPQLFENGWHPGQTDDPRKILEEIRDQVGDEDAATVVFYLNSSGQFDCRFSAWVRLEDGDR